MDFLLNNYADYLIGCLALSLVFNGFSAIVRKIREVV